MSSPTPSKFFVCCNRAFTSKDSFAKHKLEKHSQIISFRNSANAQSVDRPATKINIVPSKSMSISVRTIPSQPQQVLPPKPKLLPAEPQPSTSAAAIASTSYSNGGSVDVYQVPPPTTPNLNTNGNGGYEEYPDEEDDQDFYANAISQCTAVLKEETDEVLNFDDENEEEDEEINSVPQYPQHNNSDDCTGYGYVIGQMQYRCNSCYKVAPSVPVLKIHYESMHRPVKSNNKCGLCGINIKHRCNFTRHLRTCHIPEGIPCPFCTCTFYTQLGLNSHVVKIHSVEEQRTYLNIRPMTKSSFRRLPKEEKIIRSNEIKGDSANSGEVRYEPPQPQPSQPEKKQNNNIVIPENNIQDFYDDGDGEEGDDDPALYGNLKSEIVRTVKGKFYECRLCGKLMKSRINLRQHMLIHSGEKPLACVLCGIKFRFECNRRRHMRTCHNATGEFECTLCSCKFTSPVGLKVHISKYHNASVPAKTAIKKSIAQLRTKAKLERRLMIGNANNSITITNSNPIVDTEDKNDSENSEVHKCDQCGKLLNSKLNLRNHKLIHTGEKPEVCTLCGQTFRLHSTLWGHMKVSHVENGSFPCSQCPCVFDTERGVIRHKVIYHNFHSVEYRKRGKRSRSKIKVVRPLNVKNQSKAVQGKGPSISSHLYQLMQPSVRLHKTLPVKW